jgi:CheY-like chemotaxis protein
MRHRNGETAATPAGPKMGADEFAHPMNDAPPAPPLPAPPTPPTPSTEGTPQRRALLVDADPLLAQLIDEWLAPEGLAVTAAPPAPPGVPDVVIVDLPHPRRNGGVDSIRQLASRHPGVPIIALSPAFFSSVQTCGGVSRTLGVDCVVAKPTTRETLLVAVRRVLAGRRC